MKKTIALIMAVLMLGAMLVGCSGGGSGGAKKDTVTVLATIVTATYDPLIQGSFDSWVKGGLYESLVRYDKDGNIQPLLAESWDEDGMDVIFHLRKGVKGHDGTELNADDVIFSFDTMLLEPTRYYLSTYFAAWEKVDEYTVKITRASMFVNFYEMLAQSLQIVSKEAYESRGAEEFGKNPAGFGPYTVESKGMDDTVTMKAFADYWNGKPAFETLVVKAPIEMNTAIVGLENGELDIVRSIPAAQQNLIKNNSKLELDTALTFAVQQISLMNPLKDDLNLRLAINYGINRENIITVATEGTGIKAKDMYSEYTMKELAGQFEVPDYDPEKAKEYLAKSNYVEGTPIHASVYDPEATAIAQSIQNDLGKIGITVQIDQVDVNSYSSMLLNGELEIMITGLGGPAISLVDMLLYWESANPVWGPQFTHDAEYDEICAQIRTETDSAKINELARRLMEIQYGMSNFIGLYEKTDSIACSKEVAGAYAGTTGTYWCYPADLKPAS